MSKKVLVVDDEEGVLALMQATLQDDARYQVLLARNGEEAIELAHRERPDLVFLDILLPGSDGFNLCRELKGNPVTAGAKVVMLTGLIQKTGEREAIEAGADAYFTKPFSPTALLTKVYEVLGE